MGTTFRPQVLEEKLAKLNSSQASIETLSHWCIFHMHKAKLVVETWAKQFHCCPREQRLAFLYLANDILQNSRRKGAEFVGEFWKVLPDALRDVIGSGDEAERNAAIRLITIWEERKVFGSRGQMLKEELVGRNLNSSTKNGKPSGAKMKQSAENALDKIVLSYQAVYGGQLDEDSVVSKCTNAINSVENLDKEIGGSIKSGQGKESGFLEELNGQHAILSDCIEQLTAVESSRATLVSNLREALQEQELKLVQVRNQLQAAQAQTEHADNIYRQLLSSGSGVQLLSDQSLKESHAIFRVPQSYVGGNVDQSAPVTYTRQVPLAANVADDTKSAAAAMVAKLTASTSSAQMLTNVLSSLASEVVIGNAMNESSSSYTPSEKRLKIENSDHSHSSYMVSSQNGQPPVPQFSLSDSLNHDSNNDPVTSHESFENEQPPPPSSPPPQPPLPPMPPYQVPQFIQQATSSQQYSYTTGQLQPPMPLSSYPTMGAQSIGVSPFTQPPPPPNMFQSYQTEGGFYIQSSSMPMAPISRQ